MGKILAILSFFYVFIITLPSFSSAIGQVIDVKIVQDQGQGIAALNYDKKNDLVGIIFGNVITLFFAVGAIGFTIMIVWGAVDWILSGGDKEKVSGARKRITQAIVGLVILSLTFTIMLVAGQILSINALQYGDFRIPGLGDLPKK